MIQMAKTAFTKFLADKNLGKRLVKRGKKYSFSSKCQNTKDYSKMEFMPIKITPRNERDFTSLRMDLRNSVRNRGSYA